MRIKQLRIIVVVLFISVIGVNGVLGQSAIDSSEERRVGKECIFMWSAYN